MVRLGIGFIMIKAVFFDLYNTLVRYDPPREETLSAVLIRSGISRSARELRRPMVAGDEYFYAEGSHKGMSQRTEEEKQALWAKYQVIVLKEALIEPKPELIKAILADMQKTKYELVLYDDVLPAFTSLQAQGMALGLISNIDKDVTPLMDKLGITHWLKVIMTSQEAGVSKPHPGIFHEAVKRAGVANHEVLFVGDQYQIDVMGARGAGLKGLLLDRGGFFDEITSAEKIQNLNEVESHLA
jgi:putative hydrolase of the HAD superfamily